jgi:hypothetical protein
MLPTLKRWLSRRKPLPLSEWFFVTYDESTVFVKAAPRGKEPWEQSFPWSSIVRVCFKDEGPFLSDGIYVFTSTRLESFVIPTEANGGDEFFSALVARNLFPSDLMLQAGTSTDGGFYCWPAMEQEITGQKGDGSLKKHHPSN